MTPQKIVFHDLKMNGLDLLNCHWSLFLQANNLHKISREVAHMTIRCFFRAIPTGKVVVMVGDKDGKRVNCVI